MLTRQIQQGSVNTQIMTNATGISGRRHSAQSGPTKFTVPEDYAIIKDETQIVPVSMNGSENRVNVSYADYVEIVPGFKMPRTIIVSSFARSPKGHASGRGWTHANVVFKYTKYRD